MAANCTTTASLCETVYDWTHNAWVADSSDWLIAKPAKIVLIIVVALAARWVAHRFISRATRSNGHVRIPAVLQPLRHRAPGSLVAAGRQLLNERRRQRAETIGSVLRSGVSALIAAIAVMEILHELGLDLAPLIASAGIAGVALGFGAQNIVKDVLSGMFLILEDQLGVGDNVDLGQASGTVEAVGLRTTRVRDGNGVAWYVRNGEIVRVGNKSQGWALVTIDVPLPFGTPLDKAQEVLSRVTEEFAEDPAFADDLLEAPAVLGVEDITSTGMTLRLTAKTTTDAQGRVGRELRRRVTDALEDAGLAPDPLLLRAAANGGSVPGGPT
ncbi:MAG TPA: mechanosensitive ion channel family protein [Mycobacteriales bacterium]|jgi:small conductance mechanosensitive channel